MKPSRGRVSIAPAGEGWGGLSALHALTRWCADPAALLDVSCGPQPGDPYPDRAAGATVRTRRPGVIPAGCALPSTAAPS